MSPFPRRWNCSLPHFPRRSSRGDCIPRLIGFQGEEYGIEPSPVLAEMLGATFGSALLTVMFRVLVDASVSDIPVW